MRTQDIYGLMQAVQSIAKSFERLAEAAERLVPPKAEPTAEPTAKPSKMPPSDPAYRCGNCGRRTVTKADPMLGGYRCNTCGLEW